jgi:nucleotide-binding universal stress UspA family protein
MYQRILVATDGSDLSNTALHYAVGLAALCQAKLVIVTVVPRYPQSYFEGGIAMQAEDIKRVEERWSQEGQAIVDAAAKIALEKGVTAKALAIKSDVVSDALLTTARAQECDLIVMASHGRKGIKRLLLGSETQHVLTNSPIPVLVLKQGMLQEASR